MGDNSTIEWTEATWNPTVGCSRVSEGCRNCYAEKVAARFGGGYSSGGVALWSRYQGLVKKVNGHPQWTGEVRTVEEALRLPLSWKKPRRIFVNSMSDLFHEHVPTEWIDRVFEVMGRAAQHTFQILTKRPERMREYCQAAACMGGVPPANVWLGVSVEDQATLDARFPLLMKTPAAVRWVSYEPALGPITFPTIHTFGDFEWKGPKLDWVVVGGESGPAARPFDLTWARQTLEQGRAAGMPVFVKQLGAHPHESRAGRIHCLARRMDQCGAGHWSRSSVIQDRKGSDPAEWPEDLRVREYPHART